MATVPEDDIPGVQAEPLPGRAYPRFDDNASPNEFGAAVGGALEHSGARLGAEEKQQREEAAKTAQRQADQVRVAQANTTLSGWVTNQLYTADNAAYKQQGSDAIDMGTKYLPGFDEQASQIRSSLTPTQQAAFDVHAAGQREEMNLGLARYEKEAGDRTALQTYTAAQQQQTTAFALDWRGAMDPKTYQTRKDNLLLTAEAAADRLKLGKKETQGAWLDNALQATTDTAIAEGGLGQASRFLEAHKAEFSNDMIYPALKEKINAKLKQQDADLKDGLKEKMDDATRGALAGINGSDRMISDRELQILYPHDWQQKRSFLGKAAVTGQSEAKFDQMSPSEISDQLSAEDPTKLPAHAGQGADIELHNMKIAAAQRSITKRQADPRAFATTQYDDKPIDWTKDADKAMGIISNRAATAADDSRRLGVNLPLLSKTEAGQLSYALAQAPPDRQLGMLLQMRDGLHDEPTFRALVEQVRPNDPVIAEAAIRVPRNPETAPLWYNDKFDNPASLSREILAGNDLLAPKGGLKAEEGKGGIPKGVAMPTEKELRIAFQSALHTDDAFRGNPIAADQTYAAFRARYAFKIAQLGDTTGNVSTEAAKYAAKDLIPKMDSHFSGRSVPVPFGMDPATFPDRVNAALEASLKNHGDSPKLLKGHGLIQEGRLGSGDYAVLGADGTNLATYPGTNQIVRVHLDQQYAGTSPTRANRARTREFPPRPAAPRSSVGYDLDTPETPLNKTNPADNAPAVEP